MQAEDRRSPCPGSWVEKGEERERGRAEREENTRRKIGEGEKNPPGLAFGGCQRQRNREECGRDNEAERDTERQPARARARATERGRDRSHRRSGR